MAKKLNDKISKRGKCRSHLKCNEIVKKRVEDVIERAIDNGATLWRKANERRLKVMESCLCTDYTICKKDLSFTIQPVLLELQQLNGLNLGNMHSGEGYVAILVLEPGDISSACAVHCRPLCFTTPTQILLFIFVFQIFLSSLKRSSSSCGRNRDTINHAVPGVFVTSVLCASTNNVNVVEWSSSSILRVYTVTSDMTWCSAR